MNRILMSLFCRISRYNELFASSHSDPRNWNCWIFLVDSSLLGSHYSLYFYASQFSSPCSSDNGHYWTCHHFRWMCHGLPCCHLAKGMLLNPTSPPYVILIHIPQYLLTQEKFSKRVPVQDVSPNPTIELSTLVWLNSLLGCWRKTFRGRKPVIQTRVGS